MSKRLFCLSVAVASMVSMPLQSRADEAVSYLAQREPIPDATWTDMQGKSWHAAIGCPDRDSLALITLPYRDLNGKTQQGKMIVSAKSADAVISIFVEIYARNLLRIERMELVDKYGGNDDLSMENNNTSAFNCRKKTGGTSLSTHSFGEAIDINPVQNPYVTSSKTLPPAGKPFDTAPERKAAAAIGGLLVFRKSGADNDVVDVFESRGWKWGGDWTSSKDYQHFSTDGH